MSRNGLRNSLAQSLSLGENLYSIPKVPLSNYLNLTKPDLGDIKDEAYTDVQFDTKFRLNQTMIEKMRGPST